jgi:nucleotide-binding universal stress UspA family protein
MKVLLAVDGSPCSDAAVNEFTSRSWPIGSEVRIISAYEMPLAPAPEAWAVPPEYFEQLEESAREHAESVVKEVLNKLTTRIDPSIAVSSAAIIGSPRAVILEEAERWKADLIVIGSHGYGTWHRLLLGSVSQAVVSHARCSVEVARCREASEARVA